MATLDKAKTGVSERLADDLLVELQGDFDDDGRYGKQTLQVTSTEVRVLDPNGACEFKMPIAEIKSARNEPLVGGGRLEITAKTGEIMSIITYSQTFAHKFSEA